MISPPSGIRRPSYNGAPAMRDSKDQLSNRESDDAATKTRATHTKLACLRQPAKKSTRTSLRPTCAGASARVARTAEKPWQVTG